MQFVRRVVDKISAMNPQLRLFVVGVGLLSVCGGIFETVFNNFLNDSFVIGADTRGYLEFPRELPGFLTVLFAGMLCFVSETLVAAFSAFAIGFGILGIVIWGQSWPVMIIFLIIWSAGTHVMMPIRSSITMELSGSKGKGRRLGQVAGASIAAALLGCLFVWFLKPSLSGNYHIALLVAAGAAILSGIVFLFMRMPGAHLKRPRFVWRREYRLYYILAFLFGARKQIFITFGPWVLIRVFEQPAHIFAKLWIASSLIGLWLQPMLGRFIDHFGEKRILMVDSVLVATVCAGYGCAHLIGNQALALWVLYVCYVTDHLLFGVNMARTTYLSKIAIKPEDVSPTLSMGVTINHIVSMSVPALGGLMWVYWGHHTVFIAAAGIAVIMFVFSSRVRTQQA